jgi:uncharacterized protein
MNAEAVTLDVDGAQPVVGLLVRPPDAVACYVLAPGAGAGIEHPFMSACAEGLAKLGIATLRYQFPYMQRGSRRPDPPETCHATARAAVGYANDLRPALPLIAGGKSFGGRMTSQAQALDALPGVRGLAFMGFPLHPAQKPSATRARHLHDVEIPMLFLQGTRDQLASVDLLQPLMHALGSRATLHLVDGADHSFHMLARSGRNDTEVRNELLQVLARWSATIIEGAR